jgi:hypothetical protein
MESYRKYLAGELQDYTYPAEALKNTMSELPVVA